MLVGDFLGIFYGLTIHFILRAWYGHGSPTLSALVHANITFDAFYIKFLSTVSFFGQYPFATLHIVDISGVFEICSRPMQAVFNFSTSTLIRIVQNFELIIFQ